MTPLIQIITERGLAGLEGHQDELRAFEYGMLSAIVYGATVGNDSITPKFDPDNVPTDLNNDLKAAIRREYFFYKVGWALGTSKILWSAISLIVGAKVGGII